MTFKNSDAEGFAAGSISSCGERDYQEDSFGFSSAESADIERCGFTAIIADGMGGISGGSETSSRTVSAFLDMQRSQDNSVPVHIRLSDSLKKINADIVSEKKGGGSTAAAVMCTPEGIYWCAVGDSRIYLCRNNFLTALNEDSDYFNRLLEKVISGEISYKTASENPKKDALAEYIGFNGNIRPDVNIKALAPLKGDRILICSDGVYNALSNEEICEALKLNAARSAIMLDSMIVSKKIPKQDNYTAVILEFR
ncbi:MAG: PP2C family protein-serine/threonine phosphatase [Huintestinicola sp.]